METKIMHQNIELIARQRNVALSICILSLFCCLLLSIKLLSISTRTILVPGLHQEAWVSSGKVSSSYLEENAAMYLPLLLDLDTTSIDWKRDRVLAHAAVTEEESLAQISEYFARAKEKYNHFGLSTHFALKQMETDSDALLVRAHGQLISRFGNRGFESQPAIYHLGFKWVSGRLLLKEFLAVKKEDLEDE